MKTQSTRLAVLAMVLSGCIFSVFNGRAQTTPSLEKMTLSDFGTVDFFPVPNQNQKKSTLKAGQIKPLTNHLMSLTKTMELQTFRPTGQTEMKMTAPECLYDETSRAANSPGAIHVENGDGKLTIDGLGFSWRQSDNSFFVSNRVHSTIDSGFLKEKPALRTNAPVVAKTNAPAPEYLHIFSDRFNFDGKAGVGTYDGNMRWFGTNFLLTSTTLKIKMAANANASSNQLENLFADGDVVFDYEQMHVTGQRAVYTIASNIVQLSGNPAWRTGLREGRGDEVTIDRANKILRSYGNAYLKMPLSGGSAFLPGQKAATNSPAMTNRFVEIYSDFYIVETNFAIFIGSVRGTEIANGGPQTKISCSALTITLTSSNEIRTALAERNVVMEQRDRQFTANESALYTATNGVMRLVGEPTWRAAGRSGSGDEIRVYSLSEQMFANGHARLRLPAGELTTPPPSLTNAIVEPKPQETTNQFAEVFSDEYTFNTNHAAFFGNVRVDHPQMKLVCDAMSADFSQGDADKTIIAEHNVVIDLADPKLKKVRGIGDKAVYAYRVTPTATNDTVELLGNPRIEDARGTNYGDQITFDRMSSKIVVRKYSAKLYPNAGKTNSSAPKPFLP